MFIMKLKEHLLKNKGLAIVSPLFIMELVEHLLKEKGSSHRLPHGVRLVEQSVEVGQQRVSDTEGRSGRVLHGITEHGRVLGL